MQMDERKNKGGEAALRRIKEHQKENGRGRLEEKKQRGERKRQKKKKRVSEVERGRAGIKKNRGSKASVCP